MGEFDYAHEMIQHFDTRHYEATFNIGEYCKYLLRFQRNTSSHGDRSEVQYCRYVGRDVVNVSGRLAKQLLSPEQPEYEFEVDDDGYFALQLALIEATEPFIETMGKACLEKIQQRPRNADFLSVMQGASTFYVCDKDRIDAAESAVSKAVEPFI